MDAFNFIHFLKNPGYLHQVTFQEINNLIEQYPFCQNLHYLALRKAQLENHKDFVKRLQLAATYSPNRQWLFKQLKETEVPLAMSDESSETDEDQEPITPSDETLRPDKIHDDTSSPAFPTENKNTLVYKEVEAPTADLENDINETTEDEDQENDLQIEQPEDNLADPLDQFPDTAEEDTIPSHSISDNEQDLNTLMENTDDLEPNLENPEDMKLPEDKDKRVIYMEDLVDNVPPLEESHPEMEPDDNNAFTNPNFAQSEPEEEAPQESISEDHFKEEIGDDIPFEIIDSRELEDLSEEEEHNEVPSEAEINDAESAQDELSFLGLDKVDEGPVDDLPSESEHLVDEETEQLDHSASPEEEEDQIPLASIEEENEDADFSEEEDYSEEETTEEGNKKDDTTSIAPMPKSAFNSWRQTKASKPIKKKPKKLKKNKVEKEFTKVTEVADLFKKEKKKKKKKKKASKKKLTKQFAMESLLEHEDVISETLAELLAGQGRHKKAIKMYQSLIEKNPEKKEVYQGRIEQLKN
ncbi:MAG: hypothetical protein AB8F74_10870 [Saprospiraceae bacterium]